MELCPGSCKRCYIKEWDFPFVYAMELQFIIQSPVLNRAGLFVTLMVCNLPGRSVDGIFPARIMEWVGISSSRGSS